jgi:hypothetical protein
MPLVKVSGKYRHDMPGHTEQGLKEYSEVVGYVHGKPGNAIVAVAKILKKKDPSFDSLKTHKIEVLPEPPVVEPPVVGPPVEEPNDVEPNGSEIEPAGQDSGAELFE